MELSGVQMQSLNNALEKIKNPEQREKIRKMVLNGDMELSSVIAGLTGERTETIPEAAQVKGVTLEHAAKPQVQPIGDPKGTNCIDINVLFEQMKLPEGLQEEFKKFISGKGFTVSKNGEMSIDNSKVAQFNAALKEFAQGHKENFVDPNKKYIKFEQGSDEASISGFVNEGVIEAADEQGNHKINKDEVLKEKLNNRVGDVEYRETEPSKTNMEVTVRTAKKERISPEAPVSADLKTDRAGRKALREWAEKEYKEFVKDPKNQTAVDLYVAQAKYAGDIEDKIEEIQEEWLSNPENNNIKNKREMNGADIINMYLDKYGNTKTTRDGSTSTMKADFMTDVDALLKSNTPEAKKALEDAARDLNIARGTATDSLSQKELAIIAVAKAKGFQPEDILKLMATNEVLKTRTPEQIKSDKEYFVKHQAEDYVRNQQAQQDVKKPLHLADIDKHGQKLIKDCARLFGEEINETEFKKGGSNVYEADVKNPQTGKMEHKYFRFDSDRYRTFLKVTCDPNNATENDLENFRKYLIESGADKSRIMEDLNMMLQDGRNAMELSLPTNTGKFAKLEQIIGNGKNGVSNKELNRLRHLAEEAGFSVDYNATNLKRLLHVLKETAVGFGLGSLTGALGSLLTGPARFAAQEVAGVTAGQWVRGVISFETPGGVTQFTTDDKYVTHSETVNLNGRENTFTWTTKVPGETYDVTYDGQTYQVEIKEGDLWVDGQPYEQHIDGDTVNHIKQQALNAGLIGAAAGMVHGISTAGNIHAQGRSIDAVFDPVRYVEKQESTNGTLKLEIPQYSSTEVRENNESETIGSKPCRLRVRNINSHLNKGETMENMVEVYYGVQRGTPEYKEIFAKVQQFNNLKKFGGMQYPLKNTVFLPDYIVLENGKKFDRKYDPTDDRKRLKEQDIPITNGRYNPPKAQPSNSTVNKHVRGTITRGQ